MTTGDFNKDFNRAISTLSKKLNDFENKLNPIISELSYQLDSIESVKDEFDIYPEDLLEHPESYEEFESLSVEDSSDYYAKWDQFMRLVDSFNDLKEAAIKIDDSLDNLRSILNN